MLQQISNQTKPINQTISPKSNTINKAYLAFAYGRNNQTSTYVPNTKTQYYNDEKKSKSKKIKTAAIIATTAITTATILATFIAGKAGNKNIQKILSSLSPEGEITAKAEGFLENFGNAISNANNIKDDLLERLAGFLKEKNIPILKHLDNYCTGTKKFYKSILHKSPLKASYEDAAKILRKEGVSVESFDSWFEKLDSITLQTLKGKEGNKNFTKGILKHDLFDKMTKGNIADDVLFKDATFRKVTRNIPPTGNLSKEGKEALIELNKTRSKVVAKMRDINAGSAATDFITDAISLATLGVAVKSADDKEERKSIVLNLGLPLTSALACAFVGNLMAISGAPCMIFGLAMGQVAKLAAKGIDKFRQKRAENRA